MIILELENRCTGNRTVGSNPTLSANSSAVGTSTGAMQYSLQSLVTALNRSALQFDQHRE